MTHVDKRRPIFSIVSTPVAAADAADQYAHCFEVSSDSNIAILISHWSVAPGGGQYFPTPTDGRPHQSMLLLLSITSHNH